MAHGHGITLRTRVQEVQWVPMLFKIKIHQKHNYLHLSHTNNLLQSGYIYIHVIHVHLHVCMYSTSQVSSLSSNTLILGTTDTRVHGRLESNIVLVDVAI